MTRDANGAILHEAIYAGDPQAAASRYTEDAVLIAPDGRYEGREQIAEFFANALSPFSDADINEWYRREEDGIGAITSYFSANHTAPFRLPDGQMLPATGKRITISAMEFLRLNGDDQITEHHLYWDRLDVLEQLGVKASFLAPVS